MSRLWQNLEYLNKEYQNIQYLNTGVECWVIFLYLLQHHFAPSLPRPTGPAYWKCPDPKNPAIPGFSKIPSRKSHDSARPCLSRLTSFFGAATFNCGISLVGLSSADSWHHRTIQPPRKPSSVLALVCDEENTFTFSSMINTDLHFKMIEDNLTLQTIWHQELETRQFYPGQ